MFASIKKITFKIGQPSVSHEQKKEKKEKKKKIEY